MFEKRLSTIESAERGGLPPDAPVIIDVTRLIWRSWAGTLPTGVDKVCLAYLEHFGHRARALVQKNELRLVLSVKDSQRLFALLLKPGKTFRRRLLAMGPGSLARALLERDVSGQIYLNVGHTGLHAPGLPDWVRARKLKAVYLVHDLIPVTHPEFCRPGQDELHRQRIRNALASAAGIITNSRFTLDVLEGFAEESGVVLPPASAAWIAGQAAPEIVARSTLGKPHFVTVGTIEGRKNHILLLRLWKRLADRLGETTPKLVIIGQRGWEAEHAIAMLDRCPTIQPHVLELRSAADEDVAGLIAGARALLMPSFVEGFGMPVVEALHLGTPVIASDQPVFREIAGDLPTYISSHDGVKWERTVLEFLGDGPERLRQLAALAGYRAPTWATHFARVERFLATL
ncbi:MAG: glycosyltransferase family 4 protein [Sphingomonadales bacterium]|nr:glycosyltransferase family 4 protein [Sphingomonadales bacterium]MDE2570635.1 glycosyltransferase family 4 protein [Sphingomonadales bacterium]